MAGRRILGGRPGEGEPGWERDDRTVGWIYGSMLTGAAVVIATAKVATRPWQVPVYTAVAMAVVWLSHSYAAFVGHGGGVRASDRPRLLVHALRTELPVLASAIPAIAAAAIAGLLGADVSGVGYAAVLASVATMAVTAALAARKTGAGAMGIAFGAISACFVGAFLIAAKVALK